MACKTLAYTLLQFNASPLQLCKVNPGNGLRVCFWNNRWDMANSTHNPNTTLIGRGGTPPDAFLV